LPGDTSVGYLWDDEPCPEEDCDGDLQQQDQFNVMCLDCEAVWTHIKWDDERHELQTADGETVATKRRTVMTDGGVESGGATVQLPDDADIPSTLEVTFPVEEALNGRTPEESNLADEDIESFVDMTADIERSRALRDLAEEIVDEDELPEATGLLWVDQAEVYSLCDHHYREKRDGAWTGSTQNPHYQELREQKEQALRDGRPCTDCLEDRISELKEAIDERVEITVEVDGWETN
jgi:hypothetical protein